MKAVVFSAPGRIEHRELPLPEPGPLEVRVRSAYCGICATDLAMLEGSDRVRYPFVPGHEWSGVVDAVGSGVDPSLLGSRCVAENVLPDGGEVGFEHPGGYGETFLTRAEVIHPLPGSIPLRRAALIEPLAVCVRGTRRLRPLERGSTLVLGDGVIGLLLLLLLRARGVEDVVLAGGRQPRLRMARELGARVTVDYHGGSPSSPELAERIALAAGVTGFANALEASGSSAALEAAFRLGAQGAHILLLGDYARASATVPWQRWLHREYEVMASNASAGAWPEALEAAARLGSTLDALVTHTVRPDEVEHGIELMRDRSSGAIRVLIDWGIGGG